jgi:hypothetical protein
MGWHSVRSSIIYWLRFCWRHTKVSLLWFWGFNHSYSGVAMKIRSMNDYGTRLEHLADLHELWMDGIEILSRGTYQTEFEKAMIEELKIATTLLARHMTKDYNQSSYAQEINKIGKIPPPEIA